MATRPAEVTERKPEKTYLLGHPGALWLKAPEGVVGSDINAALCAKVGTVLYETKRSQ